MSDDDALDLDGDGVPDLTPEELETGIDVSHLLDAAEIDDEGPAFGQSPSLEEQDDPGVTIEWDDDEGDA